MSWASKQLVSCGLSQIFRKVCVSACIRNSRTWIGALVILMHEWNGLPIPTLDGFTGFVPPEGDGTYGVCIVGEAPGEMEARYGKPFYEQAPAGSCLRRLLSRAGLDR